MEGLISRRDAEAQRLTESKRGVILIEEYFPLGLRVFAEDANAHMIIYAE